MFTVNPYIVLLNFILQKHITDWRDVWVKFERGELTLQSNDNTKMRSLKGRSICFNIPFICDKITLAPAC